MSKNWVNSDFETAQVLQEIIEHLIAWDMPLWANFKQQLLRALYISQDSERLSDDDIRERLEIIWKQLWEIIRETKLRSWELTSNFSSEVWYNETTPVKLGRTVYFKWECFGKYTVVTRTGIKKVALTLSKNIDTPHNLWENISDWIEVNDVHNLQQSEIERMIKTISYKKD